MTWNPRLLSDWQGKCKTNHVNILVSLFGSHMINNSNYNTAGLISVYLCWDLSHETPGFWMLLEGPFVDKKVQFGDIWYLDTKLFNCQHKGDSDKWRKQNHSCTNSIEKINDLVFDSMMWVHEKKKTFATYTVAKFLCTQMSSLAHPIFQPVTLTDFISSSLPWALDAMQHILLTN